MAASNFIKSLYFLSKKIFFPVTLRGIPKTVSASSKPETLAAAPIVYINLLSIQKSLTFATAAPTAILRSACLNIQFGPLNSASTFCRFNISTHVSKPQARRSRPAAPLVLMPIRIETLAFLRFAASFFRKSKSMPFSSANFSIVRARTSISSFSTKAVTMSSNPLAF